jgi:hypothetical protein
VAFFCGAPNKIKTSKSGKGGFPKGIRAILKSIEGSIPLYWYDDMKIFSC